MTTRASKAHWLELYTPKLITILREKYGFKDFQADVIAGLTVAIVALPLSMAIAIASGVTPDRGLYTAIVGGFLVSLLGGSRFQIGGPAGAFIVLVAAVVHQYGIDGLILATTLSGIIFIAIGLLQLGTFIKYIPFPVTVGFTTGIAVIIFASQVKDLFGLTLVAPEPGPLLPKLMVLWESFPSISVAATVLSVATIAIIISIQKLAPKIPGMLVAITLASIAAALFGLPVETIGTKFGGIPRSLPMPSLPKISLSKVIEVLPAAVSFTLLGSIESLLSAVVADSMTGRRHRSNCELVAQGIANIGSALFGGFCVTGTIARTATNVRSGSHGPVSGMLHAVFLLLFMLIAAPLAGYIPLAALAGVLAVVAWNMAEKHEFNVLMRASAGDAVVLLATFLLTIFRDLTEGIVVGFSLGALLFLHRMATSIRIENNLPDNSVDIPDMDDNRTEYDSTLVKDDRIVVYRISGAFFFGAAGTVGKALEQASAWPEAIIIDFSDVPIIDSTASATINAFIGKAKRNQSVIYLTGTRPAVRRSLLAHGIKWPLVHYQADIDTAINIVKDKLVSEES
ncbi:SulP family inorganic anion transporter [Microvirga sp. W0021]|uniref:SulP family inorganic anion transporter n=1 Tax=Hohaiivirga grylli TaxID=3133970 RepID=A0ABV0BFV5_9HYPH